MERAERAVPGAGGRAAFAPGRWAWAAAFTAWTAAVALGFGLLQRYKSTPGEQERPPARWPRESRIALDSRRATLVMFAHPRCPCTSASLSELARLLATSGDAVRAHVVVLRPGDVGEDWDRAALWGRAAAIPGVAVVRDDDGAEAERFHAFTSGLVVLYSARGERLFSGGITASRGHEGDSFGRRRILALLEGRPADKDESPVFGCALRSAHVADAGHGGEAR
jgi:hypothetical protein